METPSRKWVVTQITALTGLAIAFVQAGAWSATLTIAAITIVSQALISYLVPNADPAPPVAVLEGRRRAAR